MPITSEIKITSPLFKLMSKNINKNTKTVLLTDSMYFNVDDIVGLAKNNKDINFSAITLNDSKIDELKKETALLNNLEIIESDIYSTEFINKKFDLIICVPFFGGRELPKENNHFICRRYDAIALENLSVYLTDGGILSIVVPASITYGSGDLEILRNYIQSNYAIKEISSLPSEILESCTGLKTVLLNISTGATEDVEVNRYKLENNNLVSYEDTLALLDELENMQCWNIDRLFSLTDEDYQRFINSGVKKNYLKEVTEIIFRGKNIPLSKKDNIGRIGVINISNINEIDIDYSNLEFIDDEERKISNYILQDGDILLPARGTTIKTAIFEKQQFTCIASSNVIVIRPNKNLIKSEYLKLFLDSSVGKKMLKSMQQGTVIMNISYQELGNLEVPMPDINEQTGISEKYKKELDLYKKTIEEANKRWSSVIKELEGKL